MPERFSANGFASLTGTTADGDRGLRGPRLTDVPRDSPGIGAADDESADPWPALIADRIRVGGDLDATNPHVEGGRTQFDDIVARRGRTGDPGSVSRHRVRRQPVAWCGEFADSGTLRVARGWFPR
ncbi:hypothetical protein GCM10022222_15650 [Amycolatopsis ultiminotia]|uniref:Uncharacterized protein n=1 Tax=Amycolatopsis ultiminotia TaxID=543629 RepID=A0ABP6VDN4_9PSEU